MKKKVLPIINALLAAFFYALSIPLSKLFLNNVSPTLMASFLYLGAGFGIGIMYLFVYKKEKKEERLSKEDIPYTIGFVLLDILAPILLMIGIGIGNASNASILSNFEIVATTVIALLFFKEKVSKTLWYAIILITMSSFILSFEEIGLFKFSLGSVLVLLATLCWGLENNCTRSISNKSTYEIVTIKGLLSGLGSLIIGLIIHETIPAFKYIILVMLLGYVSYGLSIFLYVKAQKDLGASKTSAFYSIAPFVGSFLSFIILKDTITLSYIIGLIIMIIGTILVIKDTLKDNQ